MCDITWRVCVQCSCQSTRVWQRHRARCQLPSAVSVRKRSGGGAGIGVHVLRSEQHLLSVSRVTECRLRIVGDNLCDRVKRVLADVVLVVDGQLDGQVMYAVASQY